MDLKLENKSQAKIFFCHLFKDIFQISLLCFLFSIILEKIKPGIISSYINIIWLILLIVLSGIGALYFNKYSLDSKKVIKRKFLVSSLFGCLAFIFIIAFMWDYGVWTYVCAGFGGFAVYLACDLFLS